MDENQLLITLNPAGVSGAAQRIAAHTSHVVATCLRALVQDDLSPPDVHTGFMGYRFPSLDSTGAERRTTFENWVLSKGFQDLARGVRETLEEAVVYLQLKQMNRRATTLARFEANVATIRTRSQKHSFPQLLETVNSGLLKPMAFEEEFLSLQKVRNCLEHRGGRVGAKDVDPATGVLSLSFPRLKFFYLRGKDEIELAPGVVIDTHAIGTPFGTGNEVPIYIKRVTRSRDYKLDEPIKIGASDFYEIAMACYLFAADIAAKLPTLPPIAPAVPTR